MAGVRGAGTGVVAGAGAGLTGAAVGVAVVADAGLVGALAAGAEVVVTGTAFGGVLVAVAFNGGGGMVMLGFWVAVCVAVWAVAGGSLVDVAGVFVGGNG